MPGAGTLPPPEKEDYPFAEAGTGNTTGDDKCSTPLEVNQVAIDDQKTSDNRRKVHILDKICNRVPDWFLQMVYRDR
jgi:hypothetical protein